jgi:hypothetical protein
MNLEAMLQGTQAAGQHGKPLEIRSGSLEQLQKFAESGYLFAILDACDTPEVPERARELGKERAVCLYEGSSEEDYWAVAPYLVSVDLPLLQWIMDTLAAGPWGIFLIGKADMRTLCIHFQRFLRVKLANGEQAFFRYYDPRVLKLYLPLCTATELNDLFGPVRAFGLMEDKEFKIAMRSAT